MPWETPASNAFKYSPPDHPIEVRGRIINDRLEVLVVDRGVGVPQQDLSRIFDKFYPISEFGSHSGLGLGLAICEAFVELVHRAGGSCAKSGASVLTIISAEMSGWKRLIGLLCKKNNDVDRYGLRLSKCVQPVLIS